MVWAQFGCRMETRDAFEARMHACVWLPIGNEKAPFVWDTVNSGGVKTRLHSDVRNIFEVGHFKRQTASRPVVLDTPDRHSL